MEIRYRNCYIKLKEKLGSRHSTVGILLHNLAILFAHGGLLEHAKKAEKHAISIFYESLGQKHARTLEAEDALLYYQNSTIFAKENSTIFTILFPFKSIIKLIL